MAEVKVETPKVEVEAPKEKIAVVPVAPVKKVIPVAPVVVKKVHKGPTCH